MVVIHVQDANTNSDTVLDENFIRLIGHWDLLNLHDILTLVFLFSLVLVGLSLWWGSCGFLCYGFHSLRVLHVESMCRQVSLGFRDLFQCRSVNLIEVRGQKAIRTNYPCFYDDGFSNRPTVQIKAVNLTLKLVWTGQARAKNWRCTQKFGAAIHLPV